MSMNNKKYTFQELIEITRKMFLQIQGLLFKGWQKNPAISRNIEEKLR